MRVIGFVTGLTAELALLRGTGFRGRAGGGTPGGAAAAAAQLAAEGATALISFGLAGGLDPSLHPGAILIPARVQAGQESYATDAALNAWLGGPNTATHLAGEEIIATASDKAAAFARTRAAGIDLESGAVAQIARARGLPFAVLRVVADPATRTLAPAALVALDPQGRISALRLAAALLRNPLQIPSLIALGQDAARARAALVAKLGSLRQSA